MCDISEIFGRYKPTKKLKEADIFHLYDTGKNCVDNDSGYHDSRHFNLVAFNTKTLEKCDMGIYDGIQNLSDDKIVDLIRIFSDGSTIVRFRQPVEVAQCIQCATVH